jgi:LPS export ABC transporter protein LptC
MIRPLLLVAVIAASTACGERGIAPARSVVADTSDMVMDTMRTIITRDGIKTSQIEADTAWIYQSRQVADMKGVTMTFYEENGSISSTVTAATGVYQMRDGTLDARGDVVAVTPNGRTLRTEHLIFDRIANQIRSDTAYTFTSPDGNGSGMGFVTDPDFRRLETSRASGRQRGKGFVLPGQTRDSTR